MVVIDNLLSGLAWRSAKACQNGKLACLVHLLILA